MYRFAMLGWKSALSKNLFFLKIYLFIICMSALPACILCAPCGCSACKGQKRAPDALELELHTGSCEGPFRCWEPNLGLLKKQQVLLTAEPYLQRSLFIMFYLFVCINMDEELVWRSEDNLWEMVLSSHHVGPGDQTRAIRLVGKMC